MFFIYRPSHLIWLVTDEKTWNSSWFEAAAFTTRELADGIAIRELGEGHDAVVLDDGSEE